MNIKKVIMVGIMAAAASALADVTITGVSAKQRYPWNGLIDITYTITGDLSTMTRPSIIMTAVDENTGLTYLASTFLSPPPMTAGTHTATWNPVADALHITSDRMRMTITIQDNFPLYCLVNVSGGASATTYPVTYLDAVPSGGWGTTHKTNYIVMRWCPAGTYMMQGQRKVTLTKPFYIGIFEVTEGQYKKVMGSATQYGNHSNTEEPCSASYSDIRGDTKWPSSTSVGVSSFVGKLMSKSGLEGVDLPTEAQWEYACRAGSVTELNSGKGLNPVNTEEVAIFMAGSLDTAKVGTKKPNGWGLYDMHGNAREMCLDYYQDNLGTASEEDPKGPASGTERVARGAGWSQYSSFGHTLPNGLGDYTSCARTCTNAQSSGAKGWGGGFRICMTLPN